MRIFRYSLKDGFLVPRDDGEYVIAVEGRSWIAMRGDLEVTEIPPFKPLGEELPQLQMIKKFQSATEMQLDLVPYMAPPDPRVRRVRLSQLLGRLFEDYVEGLLSRYRVERVNLGVSLRKFTGTRSYIKPDFVIEGRVAVEAKVSDPDLRQLQAYARIYKVGAVVMPWGGECRVPLGWICFRNLLVDQSAFRTWLDRNLGAPSSK